MLTCLYGLLVRGVWTDTYDSEVADVLDESLRMGLLPIDLVRSALRENGLHDAGDF